MAVPAGPRRASARAFAKLNLGLRVLDRRPDGFHNIRSVLQSIDLCDDVSVTLRQAPCASVELECDREDLANERNLAWIAADRILRRAAAQASVHVKLAKRIPAGAGLGGGSSDAGAVLRALASVLPEPPSRGTLLEIASDIGSDVPYFLTGGTALATGRGTEITALADRPPAVIVLALPAIEVSTAEAYRALAERRVTGLTHSGDAGTLEHYGSARSGSGDSAVQGPPERMANDFEDVVFQQFPALAAIKRGLLANGASQALMSGSGSALFGLFDSPGAARSAARRLASPALRVEVCRFLTRAECGIGL